MSKDAAWLLIAAPICITVFGVIEYYALRHPDRQHTLSTFIYNTGRKWPVTIYLAGLLTGILIVHLFAHFCPK